MAGRAQRKARPVSHLHRRAIQACLSLKALFGPPLRQTTGLVASLLELAGLAWPVPDFSTLCRCQQGLKVAIPYRQSTGALHLLIDSTGIKAAGVGEWFAKEHGPSRPRQWRKVHLWIEAGRLEVRAIEVTGSRVGDAPTLPELPDQIPDDQPIGKVSADGAQTRGAATPPSRRAAPAPSCLPARPRSHGWRQCRVLRPGAKLLHHPPPRPHHLETLERLPPTKPGRDQDALLHAHGRTCHDP